MLQREYKITSKVIPIYTSLWGYIQDNVFLGQRNGE